MAGVASGSVAYGERDSARCARASTHTEPNRRASCASGGGGRGGGGGGAGRWMSRQAGCASALRDVLRPLPARAGSLVLPRYGGQRGRGTQPPLHVRRRGSDANAAYRRRLLGGGSSQGSRGGGGRDSMLLVVFTRVHRCDQRLRATNSPKHPEK